MPGIAPLRFVQVGACVLNGTTDIPTTVMRLTGVLDDLTEVQFPDENVGIIGGVNRSYIAKTGGEIPLEGDATFEQLPSIFNGGIHTATPTTDTGTGYVYTYNLQYTSTDPLASTDITYMVIEAGDNQQAEIMRSGFVREITLSGEQGAALMINAVVEGQTVATTTVTSGLSIPTVESILFSKGKLYIDPSTDTIGTTQKSATLLSMELKLNGWQAIQVGDGQLHFTSTKLTNNEAELSITFEYDGSATAEIVNWRAQNERALRLIWTGSTLTSGGTYTTKTLRIDLYGKWADFEPIDEQDGNDIVTGKFRVGYSSGGAKKGTIIVVNELSTLP